MNPILETASQDQQQRLTQAAQRHRAAEERLRRFRRRHQKLNQELITCAAELEEQEKLAAVAVEAGRREEALACGERISELDQLMSRLNGLVALCQRHLQCSAGVLVLRQARLRGHQLYERSLRGASGQSRSRSLL